MAVNSIVTNASAFVALRNMTNINQAMQTTQNRVSTGLRVASALDDSSNFAVAQGVRAEIKALGAVSQGLNNTKGVGKVALAGATGVSNLLGDIRAKMTELSNDGITTTQRSLLETDLDALVDQAKNFVSNSSFNDTNIIETGGSAIATISNLANDTLTLSAHDLQADIETLESAIFNAFSDGAASDVQALLVATTGAFDVLETAVNTALNDLGSDIRALELQTDFLEDITAATEEGLGNIVDADMARESARMTALQVQQQLSVQTLGIINQAPQSLLGLFR